MTGARNDPRLVATVAALIEDVLQDVAEGERVVAVRGVAGPARRLLVDHLTWSLEDRGLTPVRLAGSGLGSRGLREAFGAPAGSGPRRAAAPVATEGLGFDPDEDPWAAEWGGAGMRPVAVRAAEIDDGVSDSFDDGVDADDAGAVAVALMMAAASGSATGAAGGRWPVLVIDDADRVPASTFRGLMRLHVVLDAEGGRLQVVLVGGLGAWPALAAADLEPMRRATLSPHVLVANDVRAPRRQRATAASVGVGAGFAASIGAALLAGVGLNAVPWLGGDGGTPGPAIMAALDPGLAEGSGAELPALRAPQTRGIAAVMPEGGTVLPSLAPDPAPTRPSPNAAADVPPVTGAVVPDSAGVFSVLPGSAPAVAPQAPSVVVALAPQPDVTPAAPVVVGGLGPQPAPALSVAPPAEAPQPQLLARLAEPLPTPDPAPSAAVMAAVPMPAAVEPPAAVVTAPEPQIVSRVAEPVAARVPTPDLAPTAPVVAAVPMPAAVEPPAAVVRAPEPRIAAPQPPIEARVAEPVPARVPTPDPVPTAPVVAAVPMPAAVEPPAAVVGAPEPRIAAPQPPIEARVAEPVPMRVPTPDLAPTAPVVAAVPMPAAVEPPAAVVGAPEPRIAAPQPPIEARVAEPVPARVPAPDPVPTAPVVAAVPMPAAVEPPGAVVTAPEPQIATLPAGPPASAPTRLAAPAVQDAAPAATPSPRLQRDALLTPRTMAPSFRDPDSDPPDVMPRRDAAGGAPGLVVLAGAGDSMRSLYRRVYRGMRAPPYATVAGMNRLPLRQGSLVVFPEPPDGWRPR